MFGESRVEAEGQDRHREELYRRVEGRASIHVDELTTEEMESICAGFDCLVETIQYRSYNPTALRPAPE